MASVSVRLYADEGAGPAVGNVSPCWRVQDGAVDARTFMGWRVFHMNCHSCHDIDAVGSELAPGLVERLKTTGPDTFAGKVLKRYRIILGANQATTETEFTARNAIIDELMR